MASLLIVVPGEPRGKGRPRIGQAENGRPIAFTDAKTVSFENLVKHEGALAMRVARFPVIRGAVALHVDAYFSALKSSKAKAPATKATRPDADNIVKAIGDALNEIVFEDDARAVDVRVRKWFARPGDQARTEIRVWSLAGEWGVVGPVPGSREGATRG